MKQFLFLFLFSACSINAFPQGDTAAHSPGNMNLPGTWLEEQPSFPGGEEARMRYTNTNAVYSNRALEAGAEGKVFITFIIEEDGSVTHPRILRGVHHDLDSICLRMITRMPRWHPGTQRHKPVAVQFNLPVKFSLKGRIPGVTPKPSVYWAGTGKKLFYQKCSDAYRLTVYDCDCWYNFIVRNYNDLDLVSIDLDEMFKNFRP